MGSATVETRTAMALRALENIYEAVNGREPRALGSPDLLAAKGWKLLMSNTGEKTIAPATTSAGTVIFNTNQPKQDTVTGLSANVGANSGNFCTK